MKSKRAKATDIPKRVKEIVWERDGHKCVVCHNSCNVMPNAHYISRAKGGLGIEQNIVTLCTRLTDNDCHFKFDNGTAEERERIGNIIKEYLQSKYENWNEEDLKFKK
jgi:5-methylcytosine-specific restriction endonuclease McrA